MEYGVYFEMEVCYDVKKLLKSYKVYMKNIGIWKKMNGSENAWSYLNVRQIVQCVFVHRNDETASACDMYERDVIASVASLKA